MSGNNNVTHHFSKRGGAYNTSLIPPRFNELSVPSIDRKVRGHLFMC